VSVDQLVRHATLVTVFYARRSDPVLVWIFPQAAACPVSYSRSRLVSCRRVSFSVFVRPVKARVFLVQHRLIFDLSATSVFFAVPAGHFSLIPTAPNQFFLASNWVPLAFPTDFQISDFILDFAVLGLGSRALLISCFAGGPVHREITARQHF
jgi:hypothetical protein